jgi:hypothetical protein
MREALVNMPIPTPARTPARMVSILLEVRFPCTATLKGPSGCFPAIDEDGAADHDVNQFRSSKNSQA